MEIGKTGSVPVESDRSVVGVTGTADEGTGFELVVKIGRAEGTEVASETGETPGSGAVVTGKAGSEVVLAVMLEYLG